jgi:hypothetical protein
MLTKKTTARPERSIEIEVEVKVKVKVKVEVEWSKGRESGALRAYC